MSQNTPQYHNQLPPGKTEDEVFAAFRAERAENERLKRDDPEAFRRKVEASKPLMQCAMCRETVRCFGNNGQPLVDGEVCDKCNAQVMKERFRATTRRERGEAQ